MSIFLGKIGTPTVCKFSSTRISSSSVMPTMIPASPLLPEYPNTGKPLATGVKSYPRPRDPPGYRTHNHDDILGEYRITSFYVENLPEHADYHGLRYLIYRRWNLPNFGKIRDIYLPRRRNALGKRFGFIRLDNVGNTEDMTKALDHQYIGTTALRCRLAKSRWRADTGEERIPYKEVLESSAKGAAKVQVEKEDVVELTVPEQNEIWLAKSAIGVLKRFEDFPEIQELVLEAGWICETRIMGRGLVLLEFESQSDLDAALGDSNAASRQLFHKVMRCDEAMMDGGRLCWVHCVGLPIATWGQAAFDHIGGKLGGLVVVDSQTLERKRLDIGRILISTTSSHVDREIRVSLKGILYIVKCYEEPLQGAVSNLDWMNGVGKKEEEDSDEEEEFMEMVTERENLTGNFRSADQEEELASKSERDDIPLGPYETASRHDRKIKKLVGTRGSLETEQSEAGSISSCNIVDDEDIRVVNKALDTPIVKGDIWEFGKLMGLTDHANEESMRAFDSGCFEKEIEVFKKAGKRSVGVL